MSILHIYLFGRMRVNFTDVDTELKMTHALQALFAYLILHRSRVQSRDVIASLFWREQPQEKARGSLNTALWRLRSVIEPEGILTGTYLVKDDIGDIGFNLHAPYWLDVAVFEDQVSHTLRIPFQSVQGNEVEKLEQALQLYNGELLEGFYDNWALYERERLRSLYLNSMAYLMYYCKYSQQYDKGLDYGKKILDIDPLREEIHREMIRIFIANGQRALAVRQYEKCCELLQMELGIQPMEETQALYKHLITSSGSTQDSATNITQGEIGEAITQLHQTAQSMGLLQAQLLLTIEVVESIFRELLND